MNRIRKQERFWQVLITPDIEVSPSDSSLLIGNWEDESLRNFYVLQFESLNDAQYEAYKYPDIDWYRIILNHKDIFDRLDYTIRAILNDSQFNTEIKSTLMDPETFKNIIFDRVLNGGERFGLRYGMNDIINFTIVNPWSNNLHNISKAIENYTSWEHRDDLRIKYKKIVDRKIICLYGKTEFGTIYEIKLMPTLLYHWAEWYKRNGYRNDKAANHYYQTIMNLQNLTDNGPVIK
jgi:hypothetical protein